MPLWGSRLSVAKWPQLRPLWIVAVGMGRALRRARGTAALPSIGRQSILLVTDRNPLHQLRLHYVSSPVLIALSSSQFPAEPARNATLTSASEHSVAGRPPPAGLGKERSAIRNGDMAVLFL